jgi:hypothetical protein
MEIWEVTREAARKVASWPEWKRNIRVTKYSGLSRDECVKLNEAEENHRLSCGDYSWWPK